MEEDITESFKQAGNIFDLVYKKFRVNAIGTKTPLLALKGKAIVWMITKNPFCGNISPMQMLLMGRYDKLIAFINDSGGDKLGDVK